MADRTWHVMFRGTLHTKGTIHSMSIVDLYHLKEQVVQWKPQHGWETLASSALRSMVDCEIADRRSPHEAHLQLV